MCTYILTGFSHDGGYRVFTFQAMGEHGRTALYVRADLALARKHGIAVQELPLLCRKLLERREEGESQRAYTYGESEMCEYESVRAARTAVVEKRKSPPRKPLASNLGQTWRGPHN